MSISSIKKSFKLIPLCGLRVSPLCLGTVHFGHKEPYSSHFGLGSPSNDESEAIFSKFIELGGNFIDTANYYQMGESEKLIGSILKNNSSINREDLVITTKYSLPMRGDPNSIGNNKKNMFQSLNNSLKRLKLDYVDIFMVHFWDWSVPIDQLMRSLDDIVKSGKALHIGISDCPSWIVSKANTIAKYNGWSPFVSYQGRLSLVDRNVENDVKPMLQSENISLLTWGSLGQTKLIGKRKRENENKKNMSKKDETIRKFIEMTEEDYKIQDVCIDIADQLNRTPSQVALGWVLNQKNVCSSLIGPRKLYQLEDNFKAIECATLLTDQHMKRLNEISQIKLQNYTFPYDLIGKNIDECKLLYQPVKDLFNYEYKMKF